MIEKSPRGWFIAGTDTGIGKTHVACLLAAWGRSRGERVGVYKPVESGWQPEEAALSDAQRLWEAAGQPLSLEKVCPQRFRTPVAPYLAAERESRPINTALLRSGLTEWLTDFDSVLIEGAGGLFSPVTRDLLVVDLACEFGFPLLIVAEDRLGVIHQVLATVHAVRAYAPRLAIAGIVLSQPNPVEEIETRAHLEYLASRLPGMTLGCVKHAEHCVSEHCVSEHRVSEHRVSEHRVSEHRVSEHRVSEHRVSEHWLERLWQ